MLDINTSLYRPGIIVASIIVNLFAAVFAILAVRDKQEKTAKHMIMSGILGEIGTAFIIAATAYMKANTPSIVQTQELPTRDIWWAIALAGITAVFCGISCRSKKGIAVTAILCGTGVIFVNTMAYYMYIFMSVMTGTARLSTAGSAAIYILAGIAAYTGAFCWAGFTPSKHCASKEERMRAADQNSRS